MALDATKAFIGDQQGGCPQRKINLALRPRLTRRVQASVRGKQLSIRLVELKLRRSFSFNPSRCSVSVSCKPRTACGLKLSSHFTQARSFFKASSAVVWAHAPRKRQAAWQPNHQPHFQLRPGDNPPFYSEGIVEPCTGSRLEDYTPQLPTCWLSFFRKSCIARVRLEAGAGGPTPLIPDCTCAWCVFISTERTSFDHGGLTISQSNLLQISPT